MIKTSTLLLLLLCSVFAAQAKKYADGYIVKQGNDTLYCKIKLASKLGSSYDLYRSIETIDTDGTKQTWCAASGSVRAFGFEHEGKSYRYDLIRNGANATFAYCEETGSRLNLYSYCTFSNCGVGAPRRVKEWVIESRTREAVTISTGLFTSGIHNVRDFLYNDADLIPLYDRTVKRFSDIRYFVEEANQRADHLRSEMAVSR